MELVYVLSTGLFSYFQSIINTVQITWLTVNWIYAGFDFSTGVFNAGNIKNYQATSGLVETVAALDIPDYDYESTHHKLTSTTQMPLELGLQSASVTAPVAGLVLPAQPPAPVLASVNTYWFPYEYKSGIDTYLDEKYVVATSFDLHCDSSRLVSGVNTLGSNSQLFYNVLGGAGGPSVSTIFVLCTSMIQVFARTQLKINQ